MITFEQAMAADVFYHVSFRNADGSAVRARRNGKTKIWKTRPSQFRIPVKYGLKECFYIENRNGHGWLVVDLPQLFKEMGLPENTTPLYALRDALLDAGRVEEADAVAHHTFSGVGA